MSRLSYSRRHASAGLLAKLRAGVNRELELAAPGWRALSDELAARAESITGRLAINVACAPGSGQGHPGFWLPALSHIGLEGNLLPVDPALLDHHDRAHHAAFCVLYGVYLHEIGHADHTPASGPRDTSALAEARATLEEIRMEARVVDCRPQDARWIRCAVLRLNVADAAVHAAGASVYGAATLATLTEGRVLAGTLELDDVTGLTELLDDALGEVREPLRLLWADVVELDDADEDGMTACAQRFIELVGCESESPDLPDGLMDALLEMLDQAAEEVAEAAARECDSEPTLIRVRDRAEAGDPEPDPRERVTSYEAVGDSVVEWGYRAATRAERYARAALARALQRARHRDRDVTEVRQPGPPGKLHMRSAMQASGQRARGAVVTAKPWKAKRRRIVEAPTLRLGVLVDTSGSMGPYCDAISSALWTITGAVCDTQGKAAAVAFGDEATAGRRLGRPRAAQRLPVLRAGRDRAGR